MTEARWLRIGAVAGILFVVLLVVSQFVAASPGPKDSTSTIVTFYIHNKTAALWSAYAGMGAAVALLLFVAAVYSVLRRSEDQPSVVSIVALGAGIALMPIILVSSSFSVALAWNGAQLGDPAVARALFDLSNATLIFSDLVIAIFLAAASLAILGTRILPRWLAWLGLLAAALLLAGTASLFNPGGSFGGAPGLLLYLIWVSATSVLLLRKAPQVGQAETTPTRQASAALG
ncbi:MAG TPA: DUF4386 family protein [Chloroflexota bacterium]